MDRHDSDADGSLSNDGELSDAELQDDDSEDALPPLPHDVVGDPSNAMEKLKQEVSEEAPRASGPPESQLESVLRSLPPWKDWGRDDREELERELKAAHAHAHAHAHSQPQSRMPSPQSPRAQVAAPSPAAPTMFPPPPLSIPLPFPFQHPAAAFLPPAPAVYSSAPAPQHAPAGAAAVHNSVSSASSHSSESSSSSQQTWSFEEQFKQVRQLYEIDDNPKRKEFLDDLFGYMQKRGTPINRLPIMAKSVLDLYELYNLVIARGGLVDVINKKLWQEIIKGLHLPSSITSAAFTLRTQYMKYLYPYECEKRRLSTPAELQAAIDGNRREGRRTSYGSYTDMMQRSSLPSLPPGHHSQMSPLSLVTAGRSAAAAVNGNSHHHHHHHHPHHPHHHPHHHPAPLHPALPQPHSQPLGTGPIPGIVASELENRMAEYVKMIHKEFRGSAATPPNNRQSSNSPPTSTSPQETSLNALEMSRLTLWNLYSNGAPPVVPPPLEPQKEALNLEVREQQSRTMQDAVVKREGEEPHTAPPAKRALADEDEGLKSVTGTHIKIASRGDNRSGTDNSLVVSMELNGTMYQGVLFAQTTRTRMT